MNSYLIIYQTNQDVSSIREGLSHMRMTEHISDYSSIVLSFRDADDIIEAIKPFNPTNIPLVVIKLDSVIYTAHIRADFFEPNGSENL